MYSQNSRGANTLTSQICNVTYAAWQRAMIPRQLPDPYHNSALASLQEQNHHRQSLSQVHQNDNATTSSVRNLDN